MGPVLFVDFIYAERFVDVKNLLVQFFSKTILVKTVI